MIVSTSRKACQFDLENITFEVPRDNQEKMSRKCLDICKELRTQWAANMDVGIISIYVVLDTKYVHGTTYVLIGLFCCQPCSSLPPCILSFSSTTYHINTGNLTLLNFYSRCDRFLLSLLDELLLILQRPVQTNFLCIPHSQPKQN